MFVQDLKKIARPELFHKVDKKSFTVTVILLPNRKVRAAFDRPVISTDKSPFITYIGDKENCYTMNTYYLDALYNIKVDQLADKLTFSADRASASCKLPISSIETYRRLRPKMASWDEYFVRGYEPGKAIKFKIPVTEGSAWVISIPNDVQLKFGNIISNSQCSKVQGYGDILICEDNKGVIDISSIRLIRATEFVECYDTRGFSIVAAEKVHKQIYDILKT